MRQEQTAVSHSHTAIAAAVFIALLPAAHAQQRGTLDEIRVSAPAPQPEQRTGTLATGLPGSVLETPFAVTTVPAERIREQAGTTLQDALRNVPGAQADSGFNGSHTQFFSLRGAVVDNGTGSNRVLRDGVRLSNYPYVPAFLESVEVLRGPGAAVGVRSEPGGTVNLVTRQPRMANFGSVLFGRGEHGAMEVSADLNRVISQDNEIAARITATRSDASEWRHVADRLDGVKLGLAKNDGDRMHLRMGVEATNQTYQADYGLPAANGRPVAVPLDRQLGEPFANSTTNNRIVDLHGDLALTADTRVALDYTHLEGRSTAVRDVLSGSPLANQPAGTYARATAWEPGTDRRIDSLVGSVTSRQRWGGLAHGLYADISYYREDLDQPSLIVPASSSAPINVYSPVYGRQPAPAPGAPTQGATTRQKLHSTAVSLQDQIDLGAWSLVGGVRYTQYSFYYGTAGVLPVDETRWSPKVALLRRLSDNDTVYANIATGIAPNQVASSTNRSLPSRRSAQAEIGWKSLWNGGQVSTDVAVYQLEQTGMISSDLSTVNPFDFTTVGSARSRGVEASASGQITERIRMSAAYAYTDARYLQNAVYGGQVVPNVARHTLNLWGQYAWNEEWRTGAGLYVQSRRFADEANTTVLPGYARVDLTQTWRKPLAGGQNVELQLAVRNLLDKPYYVSSHLHVSRWITPAQGRNIYVTGTYRF
ncbi:TonB-dependent siderophore receptor [uncultured Xylophilus sp.]|uniref:TonB-dependent receptor n=1 Tax=uncultured Xylophilus sp. TaxID=296832 RepID=UPI0025EDE72C|nr:TonB-dependent siderophore receptor [uncultured Xylophilus sp.]